MRELPLAGLKNQALGERDRCMALMSLLRLSISVSIRSINSGAISLFQSLIHICLALAEAWLANLLDLLARSGR